MRIATVAFIGVLAASLWGCTTSSTGILPAGPNTYTVSETVAPIQGGGAEAQRRAITEANAYCGKMDKVFVPDNMSQGGNLANQYGPTGYNVTFRCLAADDPAVASYRLERGPDAVIETRGR